MGNALTPVWGPVWGTGPSGGGFPGMSQEATAGLGALQGKEGLWPAWGRGEAGQGREDTP